MGLSLSSSQSTLGYDWKMTLVRSTMHHLLSKSCLQHKPLLVDSSGWDFYFRRQAWDMTTWAAFIYWWEQTKYDVECGKLEITTQYSFVFRYMHSIKYLE